MRWVVGIGVATLWIVFAFLQQILRATGHKWPLEELAWWGESFGPLATLFAAAGFAALFWQIREGQRAQHRQTFDSNYFEFLRLLSGARDKVTFSHGKDYKEENTTPRLGKISLTTRKSGSGAFRAAWDEASFHIWQISSQPEKDEIRKVYQRYIHARYESNLGPYFRLIYTIMKRIQTDQVLSDDEKAKYGNLLRSQLNSYELAILGLNGLASFSADFADLIEYFHLLKYLPRDERRDILSICYSERAFAPRGD